MKVDRKKGEKKVKIVVCIKQVPASSDVKIDPNTGVLIRDGKNTKMNPYDLYALEVALRLKEQLNATIYAITMGPPAASLVLEEALWMGCDEAFLITDRKFGGADVVATSYTISQGIIKVVPDFDMIICGKQTTDGDTAQVGPEMAEYMCIPHACYVDKIMEVKEKSIVIRVNNEKSYDVLEVDYPCLVTIEKDSVTPRLPSYKRKRELKDYKIESITFDQLIDQDETHFGLKGSPTQVERMFNPEKKAKKVFLEGTTDEKVSQLHDILKKGKFI